MARRADKAFRPRLAWPVIHRSLNAATFHVRPSIRCATAFFRQPAFCQQLLFTSIFKSPESYLSLQITLISPAICFSKNLFRAFLIAIPGIEPERRSGANCQTDRFVMMKQITTFSGMPIMAGECIIAAIILPQWNC